MDNNLDQSYRVSPEILVALREGSQEAYAEIYSRLRNPVYNFLHALTHSKEAAEDISHNVFLSVWENRNKIEPEQGIHRYLFAVAKKMALHYFRHKKVESTHFQYAWLQSVHNIIPEELLFAKETYLLVEAAILKMPHIRKQIFEMYYKNDLDYEQIAKELGMNKATVANHLSHARSDIRKIFQ